MSTDPDDALLASAFRKILTSTNYHYIFVPAEGDGVPHITLDSSWSAEDGLTEDEFAAIRRLGVAEEDDQ